MNPAARFATALAIVLLTGGCHYAPDPAPQTAQQKLALAEANRQSALAFSQMMDDLEAKMIAAGAYKPGEVREARNIYPAGTDKILGPISE